MKEERIGAEKRKGEREKEKLWLWKRRGSSPFDKILDFPLLLTASNIIQSMGL